MGSTAKNNYWQCSLKQPWCEPYPGCCYSGGYECGGYLQCESCTHEGTEICNPCHRFKEQRFDEGGTCNGEGND